MIFQPQIFSHTKKRVHHSPHAPENFNAIVALKRIKTHPQAAPAEKNFFAERHRTCLSSYHIRL
jgi:hypothetical protein